MVAITPKKHKRSDTWVPQRQEIIWIDCNPQVGREMRDLHPFLVLSPANFNVKTSLVVGLPMSTAPYNADNPFAVAVAATSGKRAQVTSYVLCHQIKSFDWRKRKARKHRLGKLADELFARVCKRLNFILQLS